ncbi:photosystem reaction center subunit H [Bacillus sp. M6-12]|uniref:PRC-barrel domain-containing protein n=1 Tax=Bacillus sp. M6-12 TaxID=2054166 RepID=UPI000C771A2A|nr:PRC-barrel domain-containing protein [Bacillus sp. M6-12]PLS16868.1 photosystem reaction center subunit H [Bacillus sp. M6-12]
MKKSSEITGLPIISLSDGHEVGRVKSLIINPDKGSIDFLTIEHEDWQVSVKAIPFKKVIGIGEYAVTVESENSVIDLNEIPIANQLVNKKIKIINTKVMTRKGQLLGNITEYFTDEENGMIVGMLMTSSEGEVVLRAESVQTFGKDIIIVKEDAAQFFLDEPEKLLQLEEDANESSETEDNSNAGLISPQDSAELKEKQIELLQGKKVLKDIRDSEGNLFISRGTILNYEHITRAQDEGPGVVIELSMNVEA